MWIEDNWFRIGTRGGFSWSYQWSFGFCFQRV